MDLEFETDVKSISPDAAQYNTLYVTSHKGPCRVGVFHPKGNLAFACCMASIDLALVGTNMLPI